MVRGDSLVTPAEAGGQGMTVGCGNDEAYRLFFINKLPTAIPSANIA
jgi:hypothetical protein